MTDELSFHTALYDELPDDQMAILGMNLPGSPDARYSREDGAHVYAWDDLRIRISTMPSSELRQHLAGFVGFVRAHSATPVDPKLMERILETRLVVGIVVDPRHDEQLRSEEICGRLAGGLQPLIVLPSGIYDENSQPLVTLGAEPAGHGTSASSEALERRARSIERLRAEGVPYLAELPVIETAAEAKLRSRAEVIERAIGLVMVAAAAEGLERDESGALIDEWRAELTPAERAFLAIEAPATHERAEFTWRYEALAVLLWALGHLGEDELAPPTHIVDVRRLVGLMRELGPVGFRRAGALREGSRILDEADLFYRYHWAVVDARVNGGPAPENIDGDVVYERCYALNWLIGYCDQEWDDVTTDT